MLLDLEKLFVKRKNFGRACRASGGELVLGVGKNLFEMPRH